MSIVRMEVRDFMTHPHTVIEFDPLLTSIAGESETGKTNLWRAARLALMNYDWPESMIRDYQDSGQIVVTLSNGTTIERHRNKTGQKVIIREQGKEPQVFSGKKNVGEYLSTATGFNRVILDEQTGPEDLNFVQVAADNLLFTGNYSSIQRRTSAIVGGSQLEDAKNRLLRKKRKKESELEGLLREEQRLTAETKSLEFFLDQAHGLSEKLAKLYDEWQDIDDKLLKFNEILSKHLECERIAHQLLIYDSDIWKRSQEIEKRCVKTLQQISDVRSCIKLMQDRNRVSSEIEQHQKEADEILNSEDYLTGLQAQPAICTQCGRPL